MSILNSRNYDIIDTPGGRAEDELGRVYNERYERPRVIILGYETHRLIKEHLQENDPAYKNGVFDTYGEAKTEVYVDYKRAIRIDTYR